MEVKKTNAEIQKAYRERQKAANKKNINISVEIDTLYHLTILTAFHECSQAELIEKLINSAYKSLEKKQEKRIAEQRGIEHQLRMETSLDLSWALHLAEEDLERIRKAKKEIKKHGF